MAQQAAQQMMHQARALLCLCHPSTQLVIACNLVKSGTGCSGLPPEEARVMITERGIDSSFLCLRNRLALEGSAQSLVWAWPRVLMSSSRASYSFTCTPDSCRCLLTSSPTCKQGLKFRAHDPYVRRHYKYFWVCTHSIGMPDYTVVQCNWRLMQLREDNMMSKSSALTA